MEPIYCNFDGLDIAFQGALPGRVLRQLEQARELAEKERRDVYEELGRYRVPVMVAGTGMKGGYRYRFSTGSHRELWSVRHNEDVKEWNLYVSVRSLSLALYGYEGVKHHIIDTMRRIGMRGPELRSDPLTGEVTENPVAHIGRVDFCIDFESEDFEIDEKAFITHGRTRKNFQYADNIEMAGRSIIYARIGKMPNRQVVIYDKKREVIEKQKIEWWEIWEREKESHKKKIWRIEARAGKKELKKWNLRHFEDFESKIANVISDILTATKYVTPTQDSNPSRWPVVPFWKTAIKLSKKDQKYFCNEAKRNEIIQIKREQCHEIYQKQLLGMAPALAAIEGVTEIGQIPGVFDPVSAILKQQTESLQGRQQLQAKLTKAQKKFSFLSTENGCGK